MRAIVDRDPACQNMLEPMLFFKGFLAITTYRIAHYLWHQNRRPLALYFQSISSEVFGVDIHPGARLLHAQPLLAVGITGVLFALLTWALYRAKARFQ